MPQGETRRLYTLLELSTLLTSVHNLDQLLKLLTHQTSALLGGERSSIFLYDERNHEFWSKVAEGEEGHILRVPAGRGILGLVYKRKKLLNIKNAHRHPAFNPDIDKETGYFTRNMLACPLFTRAGGILGVMEVLNKTTGAFTKQDEKMLPALAAVAAVAIENSVLIEGQIDLFESFIESSIHALGERDRITYGHTVRVAFYADRIARAVSASEKPPFKSIHYTPENLRKLRFAALLHDIGKITVPEAILNKQDKLDAHELDVIRLRFDHIKLSEKLRALNNGGVREAEYAKFCEGLDRDFEFILEKRVPSAVTLDELERLNRLRGTRYQIDGRVVSMLTEEEYNHLVLQRGNLTAPEFEIMKSHVKKTADILGKINWPQYLSEIPLWAAAHHERPNGSGYPLGLKGDEIPLEGQILAVADIFDALTAADRPYKKKIPLEEAKEILRKAAAAEQINRDIVELFFEHDIAALVPPAAAEGRV